jgi:hypothetical protein
LWGYFYALTAHFGHWFRPKRARTDHWAGDDEFRHGQLVKRKERRKLKYAIQRMAWGKRRELFDSLEANGFRRVIQTSFIERVNLTFRQCMAALGRQTWSLPIPGLKGKYRDRTPAMALGLTDRVMGDKSVDLTPLAHFSHCQSFQSRVGRPFGILSNYLTASIRGPNTPYHTATNLEQTYCSPAYNVICNDSIH